MFEQEKEVTQPVVVNGAIPSKSPEEGTQPVKVTTDVPIAQLPEWLLKFAARSEQSAQVTEPATTPDFQTADFEDMAEDQAFISPAIPGEYEWQEISYFQEQKAPEIEPVLEDIEAPETNLEPIPVEVAELAPVEDTPLEPSENFRQEVRALLQSGQREKALTLIRENKADPVFAEAAMKTLRSQLTLSSNTGDLWEIYDELNSSSD